jgi:adenine-specific DNA-methyltransferase
VKFYQPFIEKRPGAAGGSGYTRVRKADGQSEPLNGDAEPGDRIYAVGDLTSQSIGRDKGEGAACWFPVRVGGQEYRPSMQTRWKTNEQGMRRLLGAERVEASGTRVGYARYLDDFPVFLVTNFWDDVMSSYMRISDMLSRPTRRSSSAACL